MWSGHSETRMPKPKSSSAKTVDCSESANGFAARCALADQEKSGDGQRGRGEEGQVDQQELPGFFPLAEHHCREDQERQQEHQEVGAVGRQVDEGLEFGA